MMVQMMERLVQPYAHEDQQTIPREPNTRLLQPHATCSLHYVLELVHSIRNLHLTRSTWLLGRYAVVMFSYENAAPWMK